MRTVAYDRSQVVRLSTVVGTALVITFSSSEKISAVAVTDSKNLAAMPRGNFLFLKSRDVLPSQPVIVLTGGPKGVRRYVFEVEAISVARQASEHRAIYYSVEFRYPGDVAAARVATRVAARKRFVQVQRTRVAKATAERTQSLLEQAKKPTPTPASNWRYVGKGNQALTPVEMFDDGNSTFFRFPGNMRVPAIFRIDPDGKEATVNTSMKGEYMVVGTVAPSWRLRDGRTMLSIWNRSYDRIGSPPGTGTTSPAVHRIDKEYPR